MSQNIGTGLPAAGQTDLRTVPYTTGWRLQGAFQRLPGVVGRSLIIEEKQRQKNQQQNGGDQRHGNGNKTAAQDVPDGGLFGIA